MIGPSGTVRVMIATRPVDFRKGAEGPAVLVKAELARELTLCSPECFVISELQQISSICSLAKKLTPRP